MKVTIKVVNQPHGSIWVTNHAHSVYEGENWFKSDQTELNTIFFPTQEMLKNYLHNLIEVASQSLAEMSVEA